MAPLETVVLLVVFVTTVLTSPLSGPAGSELPNTWSYEDPESWAESFPTCGNRSQSPIDFRHTELKVKRNSQPLEFYKYDVPKKVLLQNNGYTVLGSCTTQVLDGLASVSGGGLLGDYVFSNFHFHWGADDSQGSEHTFDGIAYPAELHFVHFKKSYGTLQKALRNEDGLAVVGVMIDIADSDNVQVQPIIDALHDLVEAESAVELSEFPLDSLLPESEDRGVFYRYKGSLTTPTCNEVVTWTIFDKPITMSSEQLEQFRSLTCRDGYPLLNNFRPVQKVNNRKVLVIETTEVNEISGI